MWYLMIISDIFILYEYVLDCGIQVKGKQNIINIIKRI